MFYTQHTQNIGFVSAYDSKSFNNGASVLFLGVLIFIAENES